MCPSLVPYLVVDDLSLVVCGPEATAIAEVVKACRHCIDEFEYRGMVVSRNEQWMKEGDGKSIALASTESARKRLATSTRTMGISVQRRTKNLGVDYELDSSLDKRAVMLGRGPKLKEKLQGFRG